MHLFHLQDSVDAALVVTEALLTRNFVEKETLLEKFEESN